MGKYYTPPAPSANMMSTFPMTDPRTEASKYMSMATGTAGSMEKNIPQPGPTAGGAIMSGAGGAMMASTLGTGLTGAGYETAGAAVGGPLGLAAGALIGIGSYLLS